MFPIRAPASNSFTALTVLLGQRRKGGHPAAIITGSFDNLAKCDVTSEKECHLNKKCVNSYHRLIVIVCNVSLLDPWDCTVL